MKTLTEFAAATLALASKTRQDLTAAGKTAEELPQALAEALKIEAEKLGWLLKALETVGDKTRDLKRVVVHTLTEGEKGPEGSVQDGERCFRLEYYAPIASKEKPMGGKPGRDDKHRGKRGGRGGKPGGPGGRGGPGGGRDERAGGGRGGERSGERSAGRGPGRGGAGGPGGAEKTAHASGPAKPQPVIKPNESKPQPVIQPKSS